MKASILALTLFALAGCASVAGNVNANVKNLSDALFIGLTATEKAAQPEN